MVTSHLKDVKHLSILYAVLQKNPTKQNIPEKKGESKSRAQKREKREEKRRVSQTLIRGRTGWDEEASMFFFKEVSLSVLMHTVPITSYKEKHI